MTDNIVLTYIGKPCKKYGHSGLRYDKTKACVECVAKANKGYYRKSSTRAPRIAPSVQKVEADMTNPVLREWISRPWRQQA